MAMNKYNRGMPIIKRNKTVEPASEEFSELKAVQVKVTVIPIPINFRRRQSIVRNPASVRATRPMTHTFFWDVA